MAHSMRVSIRPCSLQECSPQNGLANSPGAAPESIIHTPHHGERSAASASIDDTQGTPTRWRSSPRAASPDWNRMERVPVQHDNIIDGIAYVGVVVVSLAGEVLTAGWWRVVTAVITVI
jgi:hypothetical protein